MASLICESVTTYITGACMVLNFHREKTDELPVIPLLNKFIGGYESRIYTFRLEKPYVYLEICIMAFFPRGRLRPPTPPPTHISSVYRPVVA